MRIIFYGFVILSFILTSFSPIQAEKLNNDPLVVSLHCPATPGTTGEQNEETLIIVGASGPTGMGFITFPSGIYSSIPANATNINVSLQTTVESFGASWLNEIFITVDAPGTFADVANYQPFPSGNYQGTESVSSDYGNNDPTGQWEFNIFDSSNDSGNDAEVTFIVTLTWDIPPTPSDCNATVCNGFSFVLDTELPGLTYDWSTDETTQSIEVTESGIYTVTVSNGTETAVDEIEVIFNTSSSENDVSICTGETYTVGSSNYTTSGEYDDILVNSLGCDSLVITHLTVLTTVTEEISPQICDGQSFTVGTSTYTVSGDYEDLLVSSNGCDSLVITHLTVSSSITNEIYPEICTGQTYTVGSSTYDTSGDYEDLLVTADGCDSLVITHLTVTNQIENEIFPQICTGQTYTVGSSTYSTPGQYEDLLVTADGCDSLVITNLSVVSEIINEQDVIICQGESITVGSNTYSTAGDYEDILVSSAGCDSTVITHLTLSFPTEVEDFVTICNGETYTVGNTTYNASGFYTEELTSIHGCDSIIHTNLTVLNDIIEENDVQICNGSSYTVGNSTYTLAGDYEDLLTSYLGCDSLVITHLTITNQVEVENHVTICDGESITVGSNTYSTQGQYEDNFTTVNGCDSTVFTFLTVAFPTIVEQDIILCFGETYPIGNSEYDTSGDYEDILTSSDGCDSTVITHLTILPELVQENFHSICQGESVIVGTNEYSSNGIYQDILESSNGCDSLVISEVEVNPNHIVEQFIQICDGDIYEIGNSMYTENGVYEDMLVSDAGCDSLVITELLVVSEIITEFEFTLCDGESITVGNSIYSETGVYEDVFVSSGGCDSTVISDITVITDTAFDQFFTLCEGEFVQVGSNIYTTSGIYEDMLVSSAGCDSLVITELVVNPVGQFDNEVFICEGDSYEVGGNIYSEQGVYTDYLLSSAGCDSTVITYLFVQPIVFTTSEVSLCSGAEYNGNVYFESDVVEEVLTSSIGCDSIHTTFVNVNVFVTATIDTQNDNCDAGTGVALAMPSGGIHPYTFEWDNGYFLQLQDDLGPGTYTVTVTDANGCSGIAQGTIESSPAVEVDYVVNDLDCYEDGSGFINVEVLGGTGPFNYQWEGNGIFADTEDLGNLNAGTYNLIVTDQEGCGFGTTIEVEQPNTLVVTTNHDYGNGFTFSNVMGGTPPYNYNWSNGETTSAIVEEPGDYSLTVTDSNGCVGVADINISSTDELSGLVSFQLAPNPNDGRFIIQMEMEQYSDLDFIIIDILGRPIYQKQVSGSSIFEKIEMDDMPSGNYFLLISDGSSRMVERFVVD